MPSRDDGPPLDVLSSAKRKEIEDQSAYWHKIREEATAVLKWHTFAGDLPSNAGAYRVSVPFFELVGGNALAFLRARESGQHLLLDRISRGVVYIPKGQEISAWRGMRVSAKTYVGWRWSQGEHLGIREIDWEASGTGSVSINRNGIVFSEEAGPVGTWLTSRITEEYRQLVAQSRHGIYASLNYRLLFEPIPDGAEQRWRSRWQVKRDEPIEWETVGFPATVSHAFLYSEVPNRLSNLGQAIAVIPSLAGPTDTRHHEGISWNTSMMQPDRMLVYETHDTKLVPVWDNAPSQSSFAVGAVQCEQ
jgi:hypothetical protein